MPRALITGCSSGFGLEATLSLARRGWDVVATMRNLDKRDRLDKRVADAGLAHRMTVQQLDVNDAPSIAAAVEAAGPLDALVNNAGIAVGGAFEDLTDEQFRSVMETNFFGVLALTRAVLPGMRARGVGRVVVVSSDSAFYGAPAMSAYTASKWAVEGWAESIAHEVAPFGIDVSLVEPGSYKTDIWDSSPRVIPDDSAYAALAEPVQTFVDEKLIPSGRDPREVGEVIADACTSPKPRFRYPVGPDAKAMHAARGVLPHRTIAWGIRRMIGL
jgi:NAD(P)-dependent dehydrogenase (short-subunit alcohol dehydrogenase family)